jgi:oligopeptide transport system ATP-binding protein
MIPLLQVQDLCKEFETATFWRHRPVRVIDGVDLSVHSGDTLGLVGESGCGKTTLARCMLRLIEPTSGSIRFQDQDLRLLSASELRARRKDFQIIFQDASASLDPRMDVGQILSEPYEAHGLGTESERMTWIRELLATVSLDEKLLQRYPEALSGGQQQRVAIARALALKPRLLIADEPVSALDASVQAQILNLLADLQKRFGLTTIFISHSLPVIHYLCTRIAVMYLGRIIEESRISNFFSGPRHPYSQILLRSMPSVSKKADTEAAPATGEIPSPASPPPGCSFHPRCPHAMQICMQMPPELVPIGENIKVACFLYTEGAEYRTNIQPKS